MFAGSIATSANPARCAIARSARRSRRKKRVAHAATANQTRSRHSARRRIEWIVRPPIASEMRQAHAIGAVKSRSELSVHEGRGGGRNAKREYGAGGFARSVLTPGRQGAMVRHEL